MPTTRSEKMPTTRSEKMPTTRSENSKNLSIKKSTLSDFRKIAQKKRETAQTRQVKNRKKRLYQQQITEYVESEFQSCNIDLDLEVGTQNKLTLHYQPDQMLGRIKEKQVIHNFVTSCILGDTNHRCLYISGCPGVGKTTVTLQVIEKIRKDTDLQHAEFHYLNSLMFKAPVEIYKSFLSKCRIKPQSKKRTPEFLALQLDKYLKKCKKMMFFLIDEVDFLYSRNETVLYNLSQWCSHPEYSFSVILISNTMDFVEKLSPKIKSRMGSSNLTFKPYTSKEIREIIEQRLKNCSNFSPKAIDYASRKFSSYSSDLRKIFQLLRRTNEAKNGAKVLLEDVNKIWGQIVEQENLQWKKDLPECYGWVLDALKSEGGKCNSLSLTRRMSQKGLVFSQVQQVLMDLQQMGLLRLSEKFQHGFQGFQVTLRVI